MDFISYCLFVFIGGTVGAFLGWLIMQRIWAGRYSEWVFWAGMAAILLYALRHKYG